MAKGLLESGLEVYHQARNSTFLTKARINQREETIHNIIGVRTGSDPRLNVRILLTHFDSRTNTAGADGAAVLLAPRILSLSSSALTTAPVRWSGTSTDL
jgi:hypothetical protein